ncbi:transposase IS3/IS911 family protein [Desulfovibrio sp. X2]|nr:transposase IS3/IS911 family protein [Desulfovibrio sp. X2]
MDRKGQAPEQIIAKLHETEVSLATSKTVAETFRVLGICKQTLYHWCNEYGGFKVD